MEVATITCQCQKPTIHAHVAYSLALRSAFPYCLHHKHALQELRNVSIASPAPNSAELVRLGGGWPGLEAPGRAHGKTGLRWGTDPGEGLRPAPAQGKARFETLLLSSLPAV